MTEAAHALEKYYTMNARFLGATLGSAATDTYKDKSPEGYYSLSLSVNTANSLRSPPHPRRRVTRTATLTARRSL
ncbi:MAG: type IV pilin protein [Chromatiales bacterium]|nr:type IV pilin protein [Chromatiales bacterium]